LHQLILEKLQTQFQIVQHLQSEQGQFLHGFPLRRITPIVLRDRWTIWRSNPCTLLAGREETSIGSGP
jgi:hypothetical protein